MRVFSFIFNVAEGCTRNASAGKEAMHMGEGVEDSVRRSVNRLNNEWVLDIGETVTT